MSDQTVLKLIFNALLCHEMALYPCPTCAKVETCESSYCGDYVGLWLACFLTGKLQRVE